MKEIVKLSAILLFIAFPCSSAFLHSCAVSKMLPAGNVIAAQDTTTLRSGKTARIHIERPKTTVSGRAIPPDSLLYRVDIAEAGGQWFMMWDFREPTSIAADTFSYDYTGSGSLQIGKTYQVRASAVLRGHTEHGEYAYSNFFTVVADSIIGQPQTPDTLTIIPEKIIKILIIQKR